MPVPEYQRRAVMKYVKNHYDRCEIRFPKGFKEDVLTPHLGLTGESANAFFVRAVEEAIERDMARLRKKEDEERV